MVFDQHCCLECFASLIRHGVFDEAAVICLYLFFISAADSTAVVFKSTNLEMTSEIYVLRKDNERFQMNNSAASSG